MEYPIITSEKISHKKLYAPYENKKNSLRHSYVNKAREIAQALQRGVDINNDAYYVKLKAEIRKEAVEDKNFLKGDYVIMCYEKVFEEVERITKMHDEATEAKIEAQYSRILELLEELEKAEQNYTMLLKKHFILQLKNIAMQKELQQYRNELAQLKQHKVVNSSHYVSVSADSSAGTGKAKKPVTDKQEFNRWELGRRLRVSENHVRKIFAHHHSKAEDKMSVTAFCDRHRITRNHYYRIVKANVKIEEDKAWLESISRDEYYKANPEELAKRVKEEAEREKREAEERKRNAPTGTQSPVMDFSYEKIEKDFYSLQKDKHIRD